MLTEEEFLNGYKPKNNEINYRSEWASDFSHLPELIEEISKLLDDKSIDQYSKIRKLLVCLNIDEEGKNVADLLFEKMNLKEILILSELSLERKDFNSQSLVHDKK